MRPACAKGVARCVPAVASTARSAVSLCDDVTPSGQNPLRCFMPIARIKHMMMSPTVAKFATVQDGLVPVVAKFATTAILGIWNVIWLYNIQDIYCVFWSRRFNKFRFSISRRSFSIRRRSYSLNGLQYIFATP